MCQASRRSIDETASLEDPATRLLWALAVIPFVFVVHRFQPASQTLLFILSVFAIIPLAAMLSLATESIAARIGDVVGGLLNATLGNLTELVIAFAALRAGQYVLVKASIAGAIVANMLFVHGMSFLLGGLKHHIQEYNRLNARLQAGLLFLATIAPLDAFGHCRSRPWRCSIIQPKTECGSRRAAPCRIWPGNVVFSQDSPRALR